MFADEHLDLTDELCEAAEREVGLDPPLERLQAELFESEDLRLRERFVREVGKRRPAPEIESFAKPSRGQLGRLLSRLFHQQSRSGAGRARPDRRGSRSPAPV